MGIYGNIWEYYEMNMSSHILHIAHFSQLCWQQWAAIVKLHWSHILLFAVEALYHQSSLPPLQRVHLFLSTTHMSICVHHMGTYTRMPTFCPTPTVYACIHTHRYVYACASAHTHIYIYILIQIDIYIYDVVHMHIHVYMSGYTWCLYFYLCIYIYIYWTIFWMW